jgi:hypothetical protein
MAVATVRAKDGILQTQMGADAGRNRLFAHIGVASAVDQPGRVRFCQLLLAAPDHQHGAV